MLYPFFALSVVGGRLRSAVRAVPRGGAHWPPWLGQRVFRMCDAVGGVAGLTTGLVVLAAVPAAFQYGLWDSNAQDRCRRLELLLLTVGWPLAAYGLTRLGGSLLGALTPPGLVYSANAPAGSLLWLVGPALLAGLTLAIARHSLRRCDAELRRWYDQHHGSKVMS